MRAIVLALCRVVNRWRQHGDADTHRQLLLHLSALPLVKAMPVLRSVEGIASGHANSTTPHTSVMSDE